MDNKVYCSDCLKEITEEVFYNCWNETVCEHCYHENYSTCDQCNEITEINDLTSIRDGNQYVCENCASRYYYYCYGCGNYFHEVTYYNNDMAICNNCSRYYFQCEDCYRIEYIDYAYTGSDGSYYCERCIDYHRVRIMDYDDDPDEFVFYGNGNYFYGVELEIDHGTNRSIAAEKIYNAGNNHIYLKHDGSLTSDGFEIITHPATLEYHMKAFPWTDIINVAKKYDYKSHDTETCGLHVHVSREAFGNNRILQDLNIAKIIIIIDRFWNSHIVPFSRRDYEKLDQWAKKLDCKFLPLDDDVQIRSKIRDIRCNGRYQAVNITNSRTVEFRFFKGTLKLSTIYASIQLLETLIQFVIKTELKNMFTIKWDDILKNSNYNELNNYLNFKNLINKEEVI